MKVSPHPKAVRQFKALVKGYELSHRELRACVKRIKAARVPGEAVASLVAGFAGRHAKAEPDSPVVMEAMDMLEKRPEFRKLREQRKEAIRRVVKDTAEKHGENAALHCAQRIRNGNQWMGVTWLPEVTDGFIRPKAVRREYVPSQINMDAWAEIPRPGARVARKAASQARPLHDERNEIPAMLDRRAGGQYTEKAA